MPSPNNTTYIKTNTLRNNATNEVINDALVTLIVYDSNNIPMTGDTFPKALVYQVGSKGIYETTLSENIPWIVGDVYTFEYTFLWNGLKRVTTCTQTATADTCGC
jgi:hypothetical protein